MKNFAHAFLLWILLCTGLNAQQLVNVELLNNNTVGETDLVDLTEIENGEATADYVLLQELSSGEFGYTEFEINHLSNSNVIFSLEEQGGQAYSINLSNGTFSIPNSPVSSQPYVDGDKFKIERCSEGVFLSSNNNTHHIFSSVDISKTIYAKLTVVEAALVGTELPSVQFSFPNIATTCSSGNIGTGGTSTTVPDCVVNPPITDDMFGEESGPCNPTGGVIFTYAEFQALDNGQSTVLGVPTDSITIGMPDDRDSNNNVLDVLAGGFGDMTLTDLYDCLDIGCSPQMAEGQAQVAAISEVLQQEPNSSQWNELNGVLNGEPGDSVAIFNSTYGSVGNVVDSLQEVGTTMSNLNIDSLIALAFNTVADDCDDSIWGDLVIPDPLLNSPVIESLGGGSQGGERLKEEIKKSVADALKAILTGAEDGGDPNWFLGEIEGLGATGASQTMPSPGSSAMIEGVQSGVDLYNGNGSFSLPLDNISSKDVNVPIAVSSSPGGLKVDAQEGLLGSNMNLSGAGKITRVIKGLPDEFNGTIDAHGYGYKRGLKLITELYSVNVGLDTKIQPKFIKRIICKIIQILLKELLNIDTNGTLCNGGGGLGDLVSILNNISAEFSDATSQVEDLINMEEGLIAFLTKEHTAGIDVVDNIGSNGQPIPGGIGVKIEFIWKALEFNYVTARVTAQIPLGVAGLVLEFGFDIRVGLKVTDVPSDVKIKKNGLGYSYLSDATIMEDKFGLDDLDVNTFFAKSPNEKLEYLNKAHATKKRDDLGFFNPKAFHFLELFADMGNFFNITESDPYPRYETDYLDLEPDEYYYDFGGYSGKFYFQPDGEIVLVPYQDFFIETIYDDKRESNEIVGFEFLTPEGVKYTFDKKAFSQHNHYTLPVSFKYPERGGGIGREYFESPQIGKVEYPAFKGFMGFPYSLEVKKDYLTNYYIEEAPSYISAWHTTEIESQISAEKIDINYGEDRILNYNSSKNWTHTFPNFNKEGGYFKTQINHDINPLDLPTEWKNGFADVTYSMSEANVTEPYIESITNNRGKVATFFYEKSNQSMPGADLCSRVEISKNGQFYKGWEFNYTTPDVVQVDITCEGTTSTTEQGQGPAFAEPNEYKLDLTDTAKDDNDKFLFVFPLRLKVICIEFFIPFKLRFGIDDNHPEEYHYMNTTRELTSLLHLKEMLSLSDGLEGERFQAEFARNFLFTVNEINATPDKPAVASFDYNGDLSVIPKRFSIHQDIWGHYNGTSSTMLPFIRESYKPISVSGGSNNVFNTDHFAFNHPSGSNFSEGRNWRANLEMAKIGQLERVTMETGGFLEYRYDLHEYPQASEGIFSSEVFGGLRIRELLKGSPTGPTKTTTYEYLNPSVVNFPIFTDQHYLDRYYKGLEERVKTSCHPLNEWQTTKGGYVGYGQVNELYDGNGRVEHYFTSPEDYPGEKPETTRLHLRYNRILRWSTGDGNYQELDEPSLSYHPTFAPLINRSWKHGLEVGSKVYHNDGTTLLQESETSFSFASMQGTNGILKFPKTNMYQYLHYGSSNDLVGESLIYQVVDVVTACPNNLLMQIARFIFKQFITQHPFRYIEKDFPQCEMIIESEKVEVNSSISKTYYEDGFNSVATNYTYSPNSERKVTNVGQVFSNGQTASTEYNYADDIGTGLPFLDGGVLNTLNTVHNYELPIQTISRQNGAVLGGSVTDFMFDAGQSRFLAETVWGYRNGQLVMTGKFDSYNSNGMPTIYRLAKHGTSMTPSSYEFFPPINMTWNANLLMTTRTMNQGQALTFTSTNNYNDLCQLTSSVDVNGLTTSYTYDGRRRLQSVTNPGALQVVSYEYDEANPLTITTTTALDAAPTQTQKGTKDGWGNLLSLERLTDGVTLSSASYDDLFRPISQCQLGSGCNSIVYEPSVLGRMESVTDAVGNETSTVYYAHTETAEVEGFASYNPFAGTFVTDPNGHISKGWADAFGKPVISISGEGGVTRSLYDSQARPERILNPIDEEYIYTYNSMGSLSSKKMPIKGLERFWYDNSMRMVAKADANANVLLLEYDDLYRMTHIHKAGGTPSEGIGGPVNNDFGGASPQDLLLENNYRDNTMWVEDVTEGILKGGGVDGQKTTHYGFDNVGRVTSSSIDYGTGIGTVDQTFTLNGANLTTDVTSIVGGPSSTETLTYAYSFDNVLRPTTTSLTYDNETKVLDALGYDDQDRVIQKVVGGGLQIVDYTYDGAGKLTAINDPINSGCIEEVEACQLYWGTAGTSDTFTDETCGLLTAVELDGVVYDLPTPLPAAQTAAIEAFIHAKIKELGKVGGCEFHYQKIIGQTEIHISIMKTNISNVRLIFENCGFNLQSKDCCNIIVMGQGNVFPIPNTPPKADLFFEQITYDGLDLSLIDMVGSCTAGLIRNHYSYDANHRLTTVQNELFNPEKIKGAFSTSYSYDLAGNIMSLKRNGWVGDAQQPRFMEIDNMKYIYEDLGGGKHTSKLERVNDRYDPTIPDVEEFAQPVGFRGAQQTISPSDEDGFFMAGVSTYDYDGNGNLISDSGKSLSASYNLLNLPSSVLGITNEYTFSGEKIRKIGEDGNRVYIGGLEYLVSENKLEHINISNGRILIEDSDNRYQFNLTDHLGNVVVMFEDVDGDGTIQIEEETQGTDDEVLQRNHYYSFGMRVNAPNFKFGDKPENKYLYNGKELNSDFDLNWLDYGARYYDPAIARWNALDPLADSYSSFSPYNYAVNNPILFIDPDGRSAVPTVDKKNKIVTINAQLNFSGSGATSERAAEIAASIQGDWNAANGTIDIGGESYSVQFNITGKKVSKLGAALGKAFGGAKNNYINLTEGGGISETGILGGNSGDWVYSQDKIDGKEYSHEFGHMLGWYDKSQFKVQEYGTHDYVGYSSSDIPGNGNAPGIMTPSNAAQSSRSGSFNSLYFENGKMTTWTRAVTQGDIDRIGINPNNPTTPITTKNLQSHPRYITPNGNSLINYIRFQTKKYRR